MCGIAGYVGRPSKGMAEIFRTFMDELLVQTQSRGQHATGVAAFLGGTKSVIGKGPVNATNFIKTPVWEKALSGPSVIAHCRYATHGSPGKNENNHPFEQGRWALIHNGVVSGYKDIARKVGVSLTTECDSEVILRVVARGAGKRGDAKAGLQKWTDEAGWGRYAIALLDRRDGLIRLLRNNDSPCAILRLPKLGIVAFASTKEILATAFDETFKKYPDTTWGEDAESWDLVPHRIYVLNPETMDVEHEDLTRRPYHSTDGNLHGFSSGTTATTSKGPRSISTFICQSCGRSECTCDQDGGTRQYFQ